MIQIVTGPPCGGKTTYVKERAKPNDVIIDMDVIALALTTEGTEPYTYSDQVRRVAFRARQAAVSEALITAQGERYLNVYIIHTDPLPDQRAFYRAMGGRIVECDPGKEVCLERLESRPTATHSVLRKVISDYYQYR